MTASRTQINVVTSLDANYLQHCCVMLCSLFRNSPECLFHVYLVINFEDNADLVRLKRFVAGSGHVLRIVKINDEQVNAFKTAHHITTATYYRLLIPALVDAGVLRILYLDVDVIIKKSVSDLWKTDIAGYALAAVCEPLPNPRELPETPSGRKYFNAGILLLNLDVWRKENISERLLQYLQKYHTALEMLEQDALNALLYDQWLELHPKWNQTVGLYSLAASQSDWDNQAIAESLQNPAIVHYTGSSKPWHYLNTHPFKHEYYTYLTFTPWQNFKHPEETAWHAFKQYVKQALNLLGGKRKYEVYR